MFVLRGRAVRPAECRAEPLITGRVAPRRPATHCVIPRIFLPVQPAQSSVISGAPLFALQHCFKCWHRCCAVLICFRSASDARGPRGPRSRPPGPSAAPRPAVHFHHTPPRLPPRPSPVPFPVDIRPCDSSIASVSLRGWRAAAHPGVGAGGVVAQGWFSGAACWVGPALPGRPEGRLKFGVGNGAWMAANARHGEALRGRVRARPRIVVVPAGSFRRSKVTKCPFSVVAGEWT